MKDGEWVDEGCKMYVNYSYGNETMKCPDGWEFDPHSGYIATVVTDVSMVLNN